MKDALVLLTLFLSGLAVLFYNTKAIQSYPYFMVATFIVITSIGLFFIFLPNLTKEWFQRLITIDIVVVTLIPIIEGKDWFTFTLLYFILLSFLFVGYFIYKKRETD